MSTCGAPRAGSGTRSNSVLQLRMSNAARPGARRGLRHHRYKKLDDLGVDLPMTAGLQLATRLLRAAPRVLSPNAWKLTRLTSPTKLPRYCTRRNSLPLAIATESIQVRARSSRVPGRLLSETLEPRGDLQTGRAAQ